MRSILRILTRYNFDGLSGRWLKPQDLFSTDGLQFLSDSLTLCKQLMVAKQIEQLQREMETLDSTTHEEQINDNALAIQMYERCIEDRIDLDFIEFSVKNDEIEFVSDRCSPHVTRALDEIGDFHYFFKISSLKPYLTPYGKKLLAK